MENKRGIPIIVPVFNEAGSLALLQTVMLFILGFQSILMGQLAELLAGTYHESQAKRAYSIKPAVNRKLEQEA